MQSSAAVLTSNMMKPRMKLAIKLYVKVGGDRPAFMEQAQQHGFTYAGSATFWHVLTKCPTPAQQTYMRVERMAYRGVLKA